MPNLVLIRGIPGSGKTTYAKEIKELNDYDHFEADMFMEDYKENYKFEVSKLKPAHQWCYNQAVKSMINNRNVIISNTFIKVWEMMPYIYAAEKNHYDVHIYEMTSFYVSIHSIPSEKLSIMKEAWEEYTGPCTKKIQII